MSIPGTGGREVMEEIGRMRPMLPVVICSDYGEDEADARCRGLEIAGIPHKPFAT